MDFVRGGERGGSGGGGGEGEAEGVGGDAQNHASLMEVGSESD